MQRKGNRLTPLIEMENCCENTVEMKNDVLSTALELKILFWNEFSIPVALPNR